MKKITINMLLFLAVITAAAQNTLSGLVTDHSTGHPLQGATLYFSDLMKGVSSDESGRYTLTDLPAGSFMLEVKYLGYRSWIGKIQVSGSSVFDIQIHPTAAEMREVVITGASSSVERRLNPVPAIVMNHDELKSGGASNIVDAIALIPGVSQITTGQGISKPVIRGLGYNRVVVLNDGLRQEEQQWGDEHGVEIDEYSVQRVEVIKGPGSIMYGSDAMAGVINFLSAYPAEPGKINSTVSSEFQTNNRLAGMSVNNSGRKGAFNWQGVLSRRIAGNYSNSEDGRVYNTGFSEMNLSGMAGVNKNWGFSNFHFSLFSQQAGIPEGERDESGHFIVPVIREDTVSGYEAAGDEDLNGYGVHAPWQKLTHLRFLSNSSMMVRRSRIALLAGYQLNRRGEYGEVEAPDEASLSLRLSTATLDAKWFLPEYKGWEISFGAGGMHQGNQDGGIEYLIPEYSLTDLGFYSYGRKSYGSFLFSGGLRYDLRRISSHSLVNGEGWEQFQAFTSDFSNIAASAGFSYRYSEKLVGRFNLSRGFRAPNIAELASNGVHEGTYRYELGNRDLKAENSFQSDMGISYNSMHIAIEADAFLNRINHYIFPERLMSMAGGDSLAGEEDVPVFRFTQDDALLYGGEVSVDVHPHPYDWIHFESTLGYTRGIRPGKSDSLRDLPLIPPLRLQSHLRFDLPEKSSRLSGSFIKIGAVISMKQDHFLRAYNTETETEGWWTLNASAGTDFTRKSGKKVATFIITGTNLMDASYQDHLSRLKYAPENPLSGKQGIFNMGRNVTFKLFIPIAMGKGS